MMKKGQAAMEFLMTYGWAILVVLAAIGALAYFGVLSPGKLVPDKCTLGPGFDIKDCKVSTSGVQLTLYNGLGADVTSVATTVTATAGSAVSACDETNVTAFLANGQTSTMMTICSTAFGADTPSIGERFDADISVVYTKSGETVNHTISGKIQRKVEQ
ncbi:hypothetical protein JW711_00400 [Candidatus Woesearchaeota archaeon]|nr:hypothetical protein [Candidatus Woesearchaeota archaeon]